MRSGRTGRTTGCATRCPAAGASPEREVRRTDRVAGYVPLALSRRGLHRAASRDLAGRERLRHQDRPPHLRRDGTEPAADAAFRGHRPQGTVGGPLRPLRPLPGLGPRPPDGGGSPCPGPTCRWSPPRSASSPGTTPGKLAASRGWTHHRDRARRGSGRPAHPRRPGRPGGQGSRPGHGARSRVAARRPTARRCPGGTAPLDSEQHEEPAASRWRTVVPFGVFDADARRRGGEAPPARGQMTAEEPLTTQDGWRSFADRQTAMPELPGRTALAR